MPGIWGIVSEKELKCKIDLSDTFHNESSVNYLVDSVKLPKAVFGRFSVDKFQNDKIFEEVGHNLICTEGIILNLKNILSQYGAKEFGELILKLYDRYDWKFLKEMRGNFSGFLYFTNTNKLIIFTDHLASKPIYYFHDKYTNTLIFASELKVVVKGMRELRYAPSLNIKGAYCLLTFAYMLGETTLVKEIKKLLPGNVLVYENGKISLKEYYRLSSKPYIDGNEIEIIKELDRRFNEAVKLEYEKDLEYGYSHIVTLSGGLDSRTNVAYAKKLGFSNITCFTFSESDYLDEKIAKKICLDNHFGFLFYALDNGDYLMKHIDEIISSSDGLNLYGGAGHMYNCLRNISFQDFGLVHTGQIGDLILGSYLQDKKHNMNDSKILNKVAYSTKLINKIKNFVDKNHFNYENDELFAFYERCINGIFIGHRMIDQFTEFSSPFLDTNFLDYAMRIHPKYRYKQAIYLKWINKSVPEFSNYRWEKYGLAPKYPLFLMNLYNKSRIIIQILINVLNRRYRHSSMNPMGYWWNSNKPLREYIKSIFRNYRHSSMNPMEYWWNSNKPLREYIKSIFEENIEILENYPELLKDSTNLFEEGTLLEKTQVLTLLKTIKLLGIDKK